MTMTRIKLIFSIFGASFDLSELAGIVRVEPTSLWYKGDRIEGVSNGVLRQETCWEYSIEFIETLFFDDLAKLFLARFELVADDVSQYVAANKLGTKIDIVVEICGNENPSISFDREFLSLVKRLNAEIDIDLYVL